MSVAVRSHTARVRRVLIRLLRLMGLLDPFLIRLDILGRDLGCNIARMF